ncbi:MAG: hypothetical protein N2557_07090 [Hydrogenophilus sp.]|nr:hypothetical protein [Hydrogenophilus sp.]
MRGRRHRAFPTWLAGVVGVYRRGEDLLLTRPERERRLLVIAVAVLTAIGWWELGATPMERHIRELKGQRESVAAEQAQVTTEVAVLQKQLAERNTRVLEEQIIALRDEVRRVRSEMQQQGAEVVSPTKMREMLRDFLQRTGLRVEELSGLPSERIELMERGEKGVTVATRNIFRHRFTTTLSGSYEELYRFFRMMEESQPAPLWRILEVRGTEGNTVVARVEFYTLSWEERWIDLAQP